jgi:D-serine deaminase-like pyridoxal phosphate-dependent protein
MTYTAGESAFLAARGFTDLLLAYPTARPHDARLLAQANRPGTTCAVVVDDRDQLDVLDAAAAAAGTVIPAVIELDLGYRPLGDGLLPASLGRAPHLGVRRSPLRQADEIVELAGHIARRPNLRFHGLMGYEAHIAGLADRPPAPLEGLARRVLKQLSVPDVARARGRVVEALHAAGLPPEVVNGGGTGSLQSSLAEPALTEVTAGSGCLASHLFDGYRGLSLRPALFFALQVVRRPAPGLVTCHGGGLIASGQPGPDRLPLPALPPGLSLLPLEGAGEVQTPLQVPPGVDLQLGDPVLFRPAKAGEPAEHFNSYLLVRGDRLEARAPTYRGLGHCFLG